MAYIRRTAVVPVMLLAATAFVAARPQNFDRRLARGTPPLTRMALWVSSLECTIDISRARSELGYAPVVSIDDGLAGLAA